MKAILLSAAMALASFGAQAAELRTISAGAAYPEGPLWFGDKLYYVEYAAHRVMAWDGTESRILWTQDGCGPAALVAVGSDLMVSCYDANTLVRISADGQTLNTIAADSDGQPFHGPNDFARDARGGLYFSVSGRFDAEAAIRGRIYYMAPDGSIRPVAYLLHYANGLALTNGGKTLLAAEQLTARILKFEVRPDGSLFNRKVFRRLRDIAPEPAGADAYTGPDGIESDSAGNVYICQYGAGRILVTDHGGQLIRTIELPDTYVTNLGFSPSEDRLYVTAVGDVWTAPYSGTVYEIANR